MDEKLGRKNGESEELITYIADRARNDLRYTIYASKLMNKLGGSPSVTFEEGMAKMVDWYLTNWD